MYPLEFRCVSMYTCGGSFDKDGSLSKRPTHSGGSSHAGPQFISNCESSVFLLNADIVM